MGGKLSFTEAIIALMMPSLRVDGPAGMDIKGLVIGCLSLASGSVMLTLPRRSRLVAQSKSAARKAKLQAGAPKQFFEERRTLDAFPPTSTDRGWRLKGAFFSLLGLGLIVLSAVR